MTYQQHLPGRTADPVALTVRVGSVGDRIVARLIDGLLCAAVLVALWWLANAVAGLGDHGVSRLTGAVIGVGVAVLMLAAFGFGFVYEWLAVGWRGATVGKWLRGLRVVDRDSGAVIGLGRSLLRILLPFAGMFFCGVGTLIVYLSVLFDETGDAQGWHDKAANDLVITTR
ncbi:MAG: RDD family protein [Mycobacteriaceae bacterium]|nr:RDD family protein [Mycobacteriaceae bacterium]